MFDHDSAQMTGHYARLHDTTLRRQREAGPQVPHNLNNIAIAIDGSSIREGE